MHTLRNLAIIISVTLMAACTATSSISKLSTQAEEAYKAGDYQAALSYYQGIIRDSKLEGRDSKENEQGEEFIGKVYARAGNCAYYLGKEELALEYFQEAIWKNYYEENMLINRSLLYKKQDNLSKEMESLEDYVKRFAEGKDIDFAQKRLLETYVESKNWDLGMELIEAMPAPKFEDLELMTLQLRVLEGLKNEDTAFKLAKKLFSKDEKSIVAMEFLAEYYFWKAENLYVKEMKAYEKNRTGKQYNILLKALDQSTADFKIALNHYKSLYKIEAKSMYAKRLASIYKRFDDEEKENYWRRKASS